MDEEDVDTIWPMIRSKSVVGLSDLVVSVGVIVVVRPAAPPPPPPFMATPPLLLLLLLLSSGSITGSTFGNNTSPLRSFDFVDGSA